MVLAKSCTCHSSCPFSQLKFDNIWHNNNIEQLNGVRYFQVHKLTYLPQFSSISKTKSSEKQHSLTHTHPHHKQQFPIFQNRIMIVFTIEKIRSSCKLILVCVWINFNNWYGIKWSKCSYFHFIRFSNGKWYFVN